MNITTDYDCPETRKGSRKPTHDEGPKGGGDMILEIIEEDDKVSE